MSQRLINAVSLTDLQVYSSPTVKILPDYDGRLNSFTFLTCIIEPRNVSVDVRWLLPSGDFVSSKSTNRTGRLRVNEGELALSEGSMFGSVLVIKNVSYRDSGLYTCEVREVNGEQCGCEGQWPAVTSVELRFQGKCNIKQSLLKFQINMCELTIYGKFRSACLTH